MNTYQFPFLATFLPLLLCILDAGTFTFFEQPCTYTLVGLLSYELTRSLSWERLGFFGLLLSIQSFLYYGVFGVQLICIPMIVCLALLVRQYFYPRWWYPYLFFSLAMLLQYVGIEYLLLGLKTSWIYTFLHLSVNIALLSIISLTYNE